ncbi:hypothetical protein LTR53_018177 [Teratosphaeriaceae sp. CCFEE 6253]|nr:hypothetical protein LTR53_018177 [Teratosphaeriaceae sp. CCFEE 6253]
MGLAAAEVFRTCERMLAELADQVARARKVAGDVDRVVSVTPRDSGADVEEDEPEPVAGRESVERRCREAGERNRDLSARVDALRRKLGRVGGQELSARERGWAGEVAVLQRGLGPVGQGSSGEPAAVVLRTEDPPPGKQRQQRDQGASSSLASRFEAVGDLRETLMRQVKEQEEATEAAAATQAGREEVGKEVRGMLERETALVEGVGERLARLSAG